jgi:hypothetical protein
MAWSDELLPAVRGMIGDDGTTHKYTDSQLLTLAAMSAGQLGVEVPDWGAEYVASVAALTITPDPVDDAAYMALLSAKTACAVSRGEVVRSVGRAIRLKDGRSEIDLTDAFRARLAAADGNWCKAFATLLADYRKAQLGGAEFVRAIVTPARNTQLPTEMPPYWGTV